MNRVTDTDPVQSRRDDLVSLGYIMLIFLRGSFPWQGLKAATKTQKYKQVKLKKMTTSTKDLYRGFANEFAVYLNYVHSLGFDEQPDYSYLRKSFRDLFVREGFEYGFVFDWTVYKYLMNVEAIAQPIENQDGNQDEDEQRRHSLMNVIPQNRSTVNKRRVLPVNVVRGLLIR